MKILLVHNRYRSVAPSGENRVVDREGAALAARGHEVIRFQRFSDDIEGWSKAKKATLPAQAVWSRESHRDLAAILAAERPDVVHLHNTFPLLSPAVLHACRDAGIPVVATIHNYKLACANGEFFRDGAVCHDCAGHLPARGVEHGCYRGSRVATVPVALATTVHRRAWRSLVSAYIFISASQRDLLRPVGLPAERSFVRHNLIPPHDRPQQERTATVVYAGRLDRAKGVRLLMAGWDNYLSRSAPSGAAPGPPLRLVIAGAGPLQGEVAAWASTRPSVELAGQLGSDQCAELIAGARAVVLPSEWEETFGLVAVEAMAAGTAPIATGHGSFTELITPGVDGVLFPPGDAAALGLALADAQQHPEQYETYGDHARKSYEQRFDPEQNLEQLIGIYRYAITHPA
ncbi:MAG TPA: glycosyltransferase [Streptosporangiaceae bacterium]|nr:glycosyltransferase [Streptosporangiaceae bacterium]